MTVVFENEMVTLKKLILAEGALVEKAIYRGIKALLERDNNLAETVIRADLEIDRMEIEVEEECLRILALHHPVAADLRFVVAVLKINNDLERMGDLAANIAKRAYFLSARAPIEVELDFPGMAAKAQSMVKRSIDALVNRNADLARQVCADDDELDAFRREAHRSIPSEIGVIPDQADCYLEYLSVTRHLERLGDMATNVAEDVIYMVEGDIIRHQFKLSQEPESK